MIFEDVPIGKNFYDPQSGEFWTKISTQRAVALTGGDAIVGHSAKFDYNDPVEPDDTHVG